MGHLRAAVLLQLLILCIGGSPTASSVGQSAAASSCLAARHLPASLQPLCPLLNAPLAPRLAQYYSTAVPAFKVHVQHLHPRETPFKDTPCFAQFARLCLDKLSKEDPSVRCPNDTTRDGRHRVQTFKPVYTGKFMAETLIPMGLELSPQHVANPADADVVVVSSCTMAYGKMGRLADRIVDHILDSPTAGRWKKAPADFVVIGTNDHGFCENSKEHFEAVEGKRGLHFPVTYPGWSDERLKGAVALLNEGSTQHRCFRTGIDVTIPTSQVVGNQPACPTAKNKAKQRSHLAFLAGKTSSRLRWHLATTFKDDPDFVVVDDGHRMSHAEYLCAMADSVFCLAPRGQAAWSPRLDEAILAGCIPVIIANHYEPPFAKVLNYSTFSVRYNESALQRGQGMLQLKETLLAIPEARRQEMLANVQAVRVAFRYAIPIPPYTPDSMTEVLMFQLWAKAHGHDFNPEYGAWESSLLVNPASGS